MLTEPKATRQIPGEPFRRWFCDNTFDLIVWYDDDDHIIGFQLCYDKHVNEYALTWFKDKGFTHKRIDNGEGRSARHKMTPILVPDGIFPKDDVLTRFLAASDELDPSITEIVADALRRHPDP